MDPDETPPSGDDPPARPPELIGPHPSPPELPGDDDGGRREGEEGARKRKRTKTGCLTCRKRRIKCDERRPICQNCIKSKRSCDGYNQRVIFKAPIGTYSHLYGPVVYPHLHQARHGLHHSLHHSLHRRHHQHQHVGAEQSRTSPHQAIAPRPPGLDFHPHPHSHPNHPQAQPQLHHYGPPLFPPPRDPPAAFPFLSPISDSESSAQFPSPHGAQGSHQFSIVQQQQQQPFSYSALAHHSHGTNGFVRQGQIYAGLPDRLMPPARTRDQPRFNLPDSRFEVLSEPEEEMLSAGESDEEMALIPPRHMYSDLVLNHLEALSHGHSIGMRSFSEFARDGALATYIPTGASSPLNNPTTAAVFAHFVNVTGPSMSLYERQPFDASRVFEGGSGASPGLGSTQERAQSIWTYTFPVIAFSHPTVMQAILALGSLQIATLSRAPPTAAMKHYHLAIRRLARNVQNRTRHTQPAILAATLLLAYFEVCSADHSKWCNHLYGARNLFREIDLRAMTRAALPLKRMRQHQMEKDFAVPPERLDAGFGFAYPVNPDYGLVDVGLLNQLSGSMLTAWDYGQADNGLLHAGGKTVQQIDGEIKEYEDLRDLFWWYAKMDIYQSVLGGTKLFMEYEDWTQCPPRSPIGKADTVYGTYDHLMLLLGRLADFAAVDLARKTKVFRHQGPPGSSPPMFPGMLPTKPKFPTGFSPPRGASPHSEQSDDGDAEAATATAHREWESIKEAFEVLRNQFGPMFEPLGAEYADRRDSPFGPTLQYRTFSMAGIWLNYYMGLIHLHRTHPSMPPIAMMAAGQAAPVTAFWANEIGRIGAGLADNCGSVTEVSTSAGAAFIESCFCLFVAAVQYQDSEQRRWMIRRMHDIGRLTGWQSARQIADGCESGWIKAYQMGRGPKYERLNEFQPEQSSIWANPRRIDRVIRESADNRLALVRSERAHYALGLLSVEHDLEQLDLKEEPL